MAYLIFNNDNSLYRIAANDTDLSNLNLPNPISPSYNVQTITDSDFESVRKNLKTVSYDGTTITYNDETWLFPNSDNLQSYFTSIIYDKCNAFLTNNAPTHGMYNEIKTYKATVKTFNKDTLTFPMNISWEEYCSNNSITYYHPLQIP